MHDVIRVDLFYGNAGVHTEWSAMPTLTPSTIPNTGHTEPANQKGTWIQHKRVAWTPWKHVSMALHRPKGALYKRPATPLICDVGGDLSRVRWTREMKADI